MKKVELLAPVGDKERLITAIHFGADAVYFAGKKFGLRAFADNFDENEIIESINYAHKHNVKVYITVNILAHNDDFVGLVDYLKFLDNAKADGVIVSDLGIAHLVKKYTNLELHVSTQANVTNSESAKVWVSLGAKRLVLARELSLKEIKDIKNSVGKDIDIECFAHGAMCISYSGRCLLSNYFRGRDSNKGACAQPCRWSYVLSYKENDENISKIKDLIKLSQKEIAEISLNLSELKARKQSISYAVDTYESSKQELENRLREKTQRLTELTNNELYNQNEIDSIKQKIDIDNKIDIALKRDFRSYLLTNVIDFINSKVNYYCKYFIENGNIEFT